MPPHCVSDGVDPHHTSEAVFDVETRGWAAVYLDRFDDACRDVDNATVVWMIDEDVVNKHQNVTGLLPSSNCNLLIAVDCADDIHFRRDLEYVDE